MKKGILHTLDLTRGFSSLPVVNALLMCFSPFMNSCFDNSDLCPEDFPDAPSVKNVPVQVVIHWDGIDVRKKPEEGMAVQLFHLEN
ncbi:MAG: hypothetical protein LBN71_06460, partial [Tannerella sp.]|nr:hypothetical protein [Tannerella sp.]